MTLTRCCKSPVVAIALIILGCVISHGLSVKTGFCYDDWTWLRLARSWQTGDAGLFEPNPWNTFRPLTHLLWHMNYSLFADKATGYHAVGLLLYALTGVSLFALIRRLSGSVAAGFTGGFLFAVGAGNAEAVETCATHGIVLGGLLGVLCLILADRYVSTPRLGLLVASIILCAAAPLSHEVAIVVPFALLVYAVLFARRKSTKRFGAVVAAAAIAFTLYSASYWAYYRSNQQGICEVGEPSLLATRHIVPNMLRATPTLVMPDVQSPALRDKLQSLSPALVAPIDKFSFGLAIALLAAGVLAIALGSATLRLGVLWCLSGLLVGSLSELGFQGRYLYIPMIAAALAVGPLLAGILAGRKRWLRTITLAVLVLLVLSNLATSLLGLTFRVKYAQERSRLIAQLREIDTSSKGRNGFHITGLPAKLKDVVDAGGYYGIAVTSGDSRSRPVDAILLRYASGSFRQASKH